MENFKVLYDNVMYRLHTQLPDYYKYHNAPHTDYVIDKSVFIAKKENITGHELDILKVAALYHDTGFLISGVEHEKSGCKIVRAELPSHGFNDENIQKICGMIMSTKVPQSPVTHLDKILADADLEYLSTKNFIPFGENLYQELKLQNPELNRDEWYEIQRKFIQKHRYHTPFCRRYREYRKFKNLDKLMDEYRD